MLRVNRATDFGCGVCMMRNRVRRKPTISGSFNMQSGASMRENRRESWHQFQNGYLWPIMGRASSGQQITFGKNPACAEGAWLRGVCAAIGQARLAIWRM